MLAPNQQDLSMMSRHNNLVTKNKKSLQSQLQILGATDQLPKIGSTPAGILIPNAQGASPTSAQNGPYSLKQSKSLTGGTSQPAGA